MEITNSKRVWIRRSVIGLSLVPLAAISILHTMGRTEDFGVLGRWYVMVPLTVAALLAWSLVERAVEWAARPAPEES